MERTWEQRLKFDYGLSVGIHLVELVKDGKSRKVLIEIGKRRAVYGLAEPREGDMYAAWGRIRGNAWASRTGTVTTWPYENKEFMAQFSGTPVISIPL